MYAQMAQSENSPATGGGWTNAHNTLLNDRSKMIDVRPPQVANCRTSSSHTWSKPSCLFVAKRCFAELGELFPKVAGLWTNSPDAMPTLVNSGPMLVDVGQCRASLGQIRTNIDQHRAACGHFRGHVGRVRVLFGRCCAFGFPDQEPAPTHPGGLEWSPTRPT